MATASDYQSLKERCERRAARATSDETKRAWLNLADSYRALLILEGFDSGPQIGNKPAR